MHPVKYLVDSVMIPLITFFHDQIPPHNYGLAIVFLTLVVKFALFPLAQRQFSNMRQMQRLQPMLKAMQDEFKAKQDKVKDSAEKLQLQQEFQAKMMAFYKEHNANPAGGCLTMIIQIPVLWALYGSLRSPELITAIKSAPAAQQGFLFIQNMLSQGVVTRQLHGPTIVHWDNLVLIALFAVTSYVTQRMMITNPNDPMQRQMLLVAPLMGPMIGWALPSGILLYFVVSGLFTIGQYFTLLRSFPALEAVGPGQAAKGDKGSAIVTVQATENKAQNAPDALPDGNTEGAKGNRPGQEAIAKDVNQAGGSSPSRKNRR